MKGTRAYILIAAGACLLLQCCFNKYMHQDCSDEARETAHVCSECHQNKRTQSHAHSGAARMRTGHHYMRFKLLMPNCLTSSIAVQASGQQPGGGQGIMPDKRLRAPPHLAAQARQHAQAVSPATPISLHIG